MAKSLCAIVIVALAVFGAFLVQAVPFSGQLGARQCTWGPSFWCSNLTNAKGCHAVSHCIQTVWEHQAVPEDNDSICKICKDMVTQARDQLRSNETMEELKEVFEGSCKLIPIKVINKECCKIADDFIPELVEALSSEMNPDQVCSVAGLCNNARIDDLLYKYYAGALDGTLPDEEDSSEEKKEKAEATTSAPKKPTLTCNNCNAVGNLISNKFSQANRDDILENLLHLCGHMSSFSDACANIVLTYFNDIYDHMKQHMDASAICHLSGSCVGRYHQHPEDPKEPEADLTAMTAAGNDDIPCELCEQLVRHLRELLTANTTEAEFKQVLEGLCNQTKGFRTECLSLADQYYAAVYEFLVTKLNDKEACFLIGVCPKGSKNLLGGDIMPLLPAIPPAKIEVQIRKKLGANEPKFTQDDLKDMALPIDHLMGAANPGLLVENGQLCALCEMVLHFVQVELSTPAKDDEIKRTVEAVCKRFGSHISGTCDNFIEQYGDAVIALLVQGLDPREICPKLQMCPHNLANRGDVEVLSPGPIVPESDESDKPTCPLCLFAVEQAQEQIKNDKSKKNIKNVLDHLCSHLPSKLKAECNDFIETYTSELIDMLITDFKPQEICVALRLCPKSNSYLSDMGISLEEEDNSSEERSDENDISEYELPVEIVFDQSSVDPRCVLCEEFIKQAEKRMHKHSSKKDIVDALHHSCERMHKKVAQQKCNKFVDRYGDKIATLIQKEMEPKMICRELGMCLWSEKEDLDIDEALKYDVIAMPEQNAKLSHDRFTGADDIAAKDPPGCVLCEFIMTKLENDLKNKTTQDEIKHTIETVCHRMPKTISQSCEKFIEQYADAVLALISTVPPKEICLKMNMCFPNIGDVLNDDIVECGVCHGASMALIPFSREQADHSKVTLSDMITKACVSLPAKYYGICTDMITIYGKSIMNLAAKHEVDEAHICAEIGKCFEYEHSRLAFVRISA